MAITMTSIANMALDIFQDDPLVDVEADNRPEARFIVRNFEQARDELLRVSDWGFAKKYEQLAQGDTPPFGFNYSYALPSDYIRMISSPTALGGWGEDPIIFERVGDHIYSNLSPPFNMRYIFRQEDTGKFDPLFARALAAYLAVLITLSISGRRSYIEAAQVAFNSAMDRALLFNSLDTGTPEPQERQDIIRARGIDTDGVLA